MDTTESNRRLSSRVRPPFANAWFFPAAALYGAFAVAAWACPLPGYPGCLPGLCTPSGHAHEMLFGYGLAVVAGYLLGPQPIRITVGLFVLWLSSRIVFLGWPYSIGAAVLTLLFATGLCIRIVPRFLPAAKKWRNRSVVAIVCALALVSILATSAGWLSQTDGVLQMLALILLAGLMFFMGGRILAPAIAGHLKRSGVSLKNRVQPGLEGAVLLCLLTALTDLAVPVLHTEVVAGSMLLSAAVLSAIRLLRWRIWLCADRFDLLMLGLGYGWLAAGMGFLGAALFGLLPLPAAIHALTIGALGTLTVTVMGRTRLLFRFRDANAAPEAHIAGLLMSGSALTRMGWTLSAPQEGSLLLTLSAGMWILACLLVFATLVRTLIPARLDPDLRCPGPES